MFPECRIIGLREFRRGNALGGLPEPGAVDLRSLGWVPRFARHDPEGLVGSQQDLIKFVLGVEGRVVEGELHHLEQVVPEHIGIRLPDPGIDDL